VPLISKKKKEKKLCGHSWGLNLVPSILLKTEWSSNQLSQFDNTAMPMSLETHYYPLWW
jgi:hypothetical protein